MTQIDAWHETGKVFQYQIIQKAQFRYDHKETFKMLFKYFYVLLFLPDLY